MSVMEVKITLRVNYDTDGKEERERLTLDACRDAAQSEKVGCSRFVFSG